MIKTLILVCASTLSHAECSTDSATAVIQGPDVESTMTCGLHGQACLAGTALAQYLDGAHYLELVCAPERRAQSAGRALPAPPADRHVLR